MTGVLLVLSVVYVVGVVVFGEDGEYPDPLWPLFALAYIAEKFHPKIESNFKSTQVETNVESHFHGLDVDEDEEHQKRIDDWDRRFRGEDTETVLDLEGTEEKQSDPETTRDNGLLKKRLVKLGSSQPFLRPQIREAFNKVDLPEVDMGRGKKFTHQTEE